MIIAHAGIAPDALHSLTSLTRCKPRGGSLRQAAQALHGPRSTLRAWRAYHESRDAPPAVVAFLHRAPGLAV
jgi:hypothetical protein